VADGQEIAGIGRRHLTARSFRRSFVARGVAATS
jgi:hypothetical protein